MKIALKDRIIQKILRIFRMVKHVNRTLTASLNGRKIALPIKGGIMVGTSEEWMSTLLRLLLSRRAGTFVDIGVNLGQTLAKVKTIDADRDYLGFEPNPLCVDYADSLIAANGWQNCQIIPAGLGARTAVFKLNQYSEIGVDSSPTIIENFRPSKKVICTKSVIIFSGSEAIPLFENRVALVKIDVEGAESDVLQAIRDIIIRDRPCISMEILPCYDTTHKDRVERQMNIEKLLKECEYRIFRIHHNQSKFDVEEIAEVGIHGDLSLCEYVMCPVEDMPF